MAMNDRETRTSLWQAVTLVAIALALLVIPTRTDGDTERVAPFFLLAVYMSLEAAFIVVTTQRGQWDWLNRCMLIARLSVVQYALWLFLSFGSIWEPPRWWWDVARWMLWVGCIVGVLAITRSFMRWFGERQAAKRRRNRVLNELP